MKIEFSDWKKIEKPQQTKRFAYILFSYRKTVLFSTEIMEYGFKKYYRNLWNIVHFAQLSAYLVSAALRAVVYFGPDLHVQSQKRWVPRTLFWSQTASSQEQT